MVYNVPYRKPVQLDVGKVIIDTDAGPDDAAAIFVTLNGEKYNSEFKVIAITCVNGNTAVDNVVVNVLKTLKTANRLDVSFPHLFLLMSRFQLMGKGTRIWAPKGEGGQYLLS
jgi:hypothetical protein